MTRRQWMWLWIWLLIFFIIFCIWSKLQVLSTNVPIKQPAQNIVLPQGTKINEVAKVPIVQGIAKRDVNFKVVKQDDSIKLSGLFSSQTDVDALKAEYQKIVKNVEEGTIIIDDTIGNSKLMKFLPTLSPEFAKFKNGYIEYADKRLIVDGIVEDNGIKTNIDEITKDNKLFTLENRVTTPKSTQPQEIETIIVKEPKKVEVEKKAEKEKAKPEKSAKEVQAKLDKLLKLKKVEFIYAKDVLTNKSKKIVSKVQEVLNIYKNINVEIGGHTDSDGTEKNNKALSQKRANAIKKYLISEGIDKNRLKAIGYGESKPLVKNDTADKKQINRRVEFKVMEK